MATFIIMTEEHLVKSDNPNVIAWFLDRGAVALPFEEIDDAAELMGKILDEELGAEND